MDKEWFEQQQRRKNDINKNVWIPLRSSRELIKEGEYGKLGYREEFFGAASMMISLDDVDQAQDAEWMDFGISRTHRGNPYGEEYEPAHLHTSENGNLGGEFIVIVQSIGGEHCDEWHISPDLLTTLELVRDGDNYLAYDRGYEEVIKIHRNENECVDEILMKSTYLKDYLFVRKKALLVTSYSSRRQILEEELEVDWDLDEIVDVAKGCKWSGRMWAVNEHGRKLGEKTAVMHIGRTDVDSEEDVPEFDFPKDGDVEVKEWTTETKGDEKYFRVEGEVWRNEVLKPADESRIILSDGNAEEFNYFVGASGEKQSSKELVDAGKYLWFKPTIVDSLLSNRGSSLIWYTQNTGKVGAGRHGGVHFGINKLGLINVFAKDIALLPDWQQKIWHANNIEPDGKVSEELLMSQQKAQPADTLPPEEYFLKELKELNHNFEASFGEKLIKSSIVDDIGDRIHRFKAAQKDGLFVLAKDITRITADSFDGSAIRKQVNNKLESKDLGSLKLMEKLLSQKVHDSVASKIMSALFYARELRMSDAHPPSKETVEQVLVKLGIDNRTNDVEKGRILIHECTSSLAALNHFLFR